MRTTILYLLLVFTYCSTNAQSSTFYYNPKGELTIEELATHYRIGYFDPSLARFVGFVEEFSMDSILQTRSTYDSSGILEAFYLFSPSNDTIISAHSIEKLPDSISMTIIAKQKLDQSTYIRKNDYPTIKEFLKPIGLEQLDSVFMDGKWEVFGIVESQPEFPGGMRNLGAFLVPNLIYPDSARINGITGRVFVEFFVQKDGTVGKVRAIKGIGHGCDEAAEFAINKLPDWKPGYQRGKAVPVKLILPITFQ